MSTSYVVIICILAGLGAGLGTGFAGLSAAAVISPMLIAFLGMDAYAAVTVSLASDVLASAVSAVTYGKNKNLDIKNGFVMMVAVMLFSVVGSWVAKLLPNQAMGTMSCFMTFFLGLKFIIRPVMTTKEEMLAVSPKKRLIQSIISGIGIGFICGFVGAGGGMMMLMVLVMVLGYELKTAVGTSVFIMAFTAFTGAVSHIAMGSRPSMLVMTICVVSTLIFANVAARIANKASAKTLNRLTGIVLMVICSAVIIFQYVLK